MAELTPMERLQPCLLDRLTDDEPDSQKESRDQRVVSLRRYRHALMRDLGMLLNSRNHPSEDVIYEFSEVSRSVLNYGIPDLCGIPVRNVQSAELEGEIKRCIECFEPRIAQGSLSVRIVSPTDSEYIRAISFEIEGEMWAQPVPDHLFVKTEVDLETGHHELKGGVNG
ncbi:MAG: type VI secretion system baseplate subunit TssE [Woeseiaceae bacterium]|nr:type VI secretion system baseplate subunit TssE [Woeseiaceae bacterium]